MKRIVFSFLIVLFLFVLVLTACSTPPAPSPSQTPATSQSQVGKPQSGGILKIISRNIAVFGASAEVTAGIDSPAMVPWDPFVRYDNTGAPTPSLATAWTIAPDGKTITFTLRKGVKFHDGTEFNAEAVKYHIENMKFNRPKWAMITSIDIIDDYTIRLNLKQYDTSLITSLALSYGRVGSVTALKTPTTPENQYKDHVVGTGPFKYVDFKRDTYLKYTKFDNYWQTGKPYLDGLEFIFINDPMTAAMAFQSGEAQVIRDIDALTAADLKKKGYTIAFCDFYAQTLAPDSTNKDSPFADKRVREAVEYAIDRPTVAKIFGGEYSKALTQMCPPNVANGYNPAISVRQYNPTKAKQLLAEAGYPNGFKTKLIIQTIDPKEPLQAVQNYLKAVGIDAEIDLADPGRFTSLRQNGWNGLRYEQCGLDANYAMTMSVFWNQGTYYFTSVARPAGFQDTILKSFNEPDFAKRQVILQSLTKTISDEAMVVPLWTRPLIVAMTDKVHDTGLADFNALIWFPENAWLSK